MPFKLANRYAFPERKPERIHELYIKDMGSIELSFHIPKFFLHLNHAEACRRIMDAQWVKVEVVHLPTIKLDDLDLFFKVMERAVYMATTLGCRNLVIHPSKTTMDRVEAFLDKSITPMLTSSGTTLCWETFLGKRRLFHDPSRIVELASKSPEAHAVCYDTAHMGEHEDVIRELRECLPYIRVIHASNRTLNHKRLHLPIFHPEGILDFSEIIATLRETSFRGIFVLEYSSELEKEQLSDYAVLDHLNI